MANLDT